jgi:S1-C subfamily serine protease
MLPTVLATTAMVSSLSAQDPRIIRVGPGAMPMSGADQFARFPGQEPRAVIGVSTTNATSSRDTLGVLVGAVRPGSPAEKAGIEEGNRIASINGVSLKLAAPDVGDEAMGGVMSRRLSRELDKLHPGDDVDLRVYAGGQARSVKVKTIAPADLYQSTVARTSRDRATLGVNLAVTGSARDTLGVFVMSVEDGGPAAKAGLEEGARIASINGVDVRGRRARGDDDSVLRASNVARLEREVANLKPGDDVELKVHANGQSRTMKFKAGRLSDLPRRNRSMTIMGGDGFMALPEVMRIDGPRMGEQIRRAIETGMQGMQGMQGMRSSLDRMGGRQNW